MLYADEEELKCWYKRRSLPHYDNDKVYQFITYRLHDSVPQSVIDYWIDKLSITAETKDNKDSYERLKLQENIFKYEDQGYGECYLNNPEVYQVVKATFLHFDKLRYDLIEWIIMPNHVHVLIRPFEGESLYKIVQSWKSYTAKKANIILNRKGKFWMENYYDRYIRNEQHFFKVIRYIQNNDKGIY